MDFSIPVKRPDASGGGSTNSVLGTIKSYLGGTGQQQVKSDSEGCSPSQSHHERCVERNQRSNVPNSGEDIPRPLENASTANGGREVLEENRGSSHQLERAADEMVSALIKEIDHKDQELQYQKQHLSKLEELLQKYKHQLKQKDWHFGNQLQKYRNHLQQKDQQIAKLESNVNECEQHLGKMRVERQDLVRNLEACKDRIFNTQPVQGPTDSEMGSRYKDMCNNIDDWVETHFGDTDYLIACICEAEDARGHGGIVSKYLEKNDIQAVKGNPETNMSMLGAVISRHLYINLLGPEEIFPGLGWETQMLLRQIVNEMGALKPAKDSEAIQMWRVDLQRTLNILGPLKMRCDNALDEISDTVFTCLQALRGMGNRGSVEYSQCRQFVQQAFELANNIRQSMELYSFDFKFFSSTVAEQRVLRLDDLKDYNVIDSRTGVALRSSANPIPGPDGRVGEALFDVHPEFVRQSTGSKQKIVLVKPTIVVRFDQEVPRGGKKNASG